MIMIGTMAWDLLICKNTIEVVLFDITCTDVQISNPNQSSCMRCSHVPLTHDCESPCGVVIVT